MKTARRMNILYEWIENHRLFVFVIFLAFIATGYSINAGLIVISIFVVYRISSRLISRRLISDRIFLFIASVFFYILLLQSVSLVMWLIWHAFPLSLTIFSTSVFAVLTLLPVRHLPYQPRASVFTRGTYTALALTFITLVVFIALPVRNTPAGNGASLIALTNYNVDDGSHLSLLNVRIHHNIVALVGNSAVHDLSPDIVSYPSGWPAANAALIQAFSPSIKPGWQMFIAYVIMKSFWLLVLVFVTVSTVFELYGYFKGTSPNYVTSIIMGVVLLLFTAWFLVDTYFYGFFSFIPQLITVPFFLISLLQLSGLGNRDRTLLPNLMLPLLLAVGSALSWLLLFPVFIVSIGLSLGNRAAMVGLRWICAEFTNHISRYAFFYIILIVSVFGQVFMILYGPQPSASGSLIQILLLNGGIIIRPASLYLFIALGVILFVTFTYKKRILGNYTALLHYGVVMLMFTSFIYALQLYKINQNFYYYFKTFDTIAIVGVILCTIGIGYLSEAVQRRSSSYVTLLSGCAVILLAFQFVYPHAPFFAYARGIRAISPAVDAQIFSLMRQPDQAAYSAHSVTIFYPSGNAELNEVASTLVQAAHPSSTCFSALKTASFSIPLTRFTPDVITKNCRPDTHITYYIEPAYAVGFTSVLHKAGLASRVDVRTIAQ